MTHDASPSALPTNVRFTARALGRVLDAFGRAKGEEPCGLLLGRRESGGRRLNVVDVVEVANSHPRPHACWRMAPDAQLEASRPGRERGLDILGTWHGHLQSPPHPSRADMEGHEVFQRAVSAPRLLVIVGTGTGPYPVVRAWLPGAERVRELPIRN